MKKMTFRIIQNLTQGSEEWRNWRKKCIGASDAAIIMGEGFKKSEDTDYLMKVKLGIIQEWSGNAKSREGQRLEPEARNFLVKKYKLKLDPAIIQDIDQPFLIASLDGIDKSGKNIFEIKCGESSYKKTKESKEIPSYYKAQLQHILMISKLDFIYFFAYRPNLYPIELKIYRDDNYINKLRKLEIEFASKLLEKNHKLENRFLGEIFIHDTLISKKEIVKNPDQKNWFRRFLFGK